VAPKIELRDAADLVAAGLATASQNTEEEEKRCKEKKKK